MSDKKLKEEVLNKSESKYDDINEDTALEIIDLEYREIEEWLKSRIKTLKRQCYDVIDCTEIVIEKKTKDPDDYNEFDY